MNKSTTIVFLGPSLDVKQAEDIFPEAIFLPPARCGDVLRCLRLKPQEIAIIDGFFENTAAVWHKEILLALEKGIKVYGAASMGALRAAELHVFGMQGVGNIFAQFASGELNDDDEVAVLHAPAKSRFKSLSDAMVNIRATLSKAVEENIVDQKIAEEIISEAKRLPYAQRKLETIIKRDANLQKLQDWLENGGYVDQKKLDAIKLLHVLKKGDLAEKSANMDPTPVSRSMFFRALCNEVSCRPFNVYADWLPQNEKLLLKSRLMGGDYKLLRRLAYFWSAICAVAKERVGGLKVEFQPDDENFFSIHLRKDAEDLTKDFDYIKFLERVNLVDKLLAWQKKNPVAGFVQDPFLADLDKAILVLMRINGDFSKYKTTQNLRQENPMRYKIFEISARIWQMLDIEAARFALLPSDNLVQDFVNEFRLKNSLLSQDMVMQWVQENELNVEDLAPIFTKLTMLSFLTQQGHLDVISAWRNIDDICWLLDVVYLTCSDMYIKSESFSWSDDLVKNDYEAFELDFLYGQNDFRKFLSDIEKKS